jgi:hypothetical protein
MMRLMYRAWRIARALFTPPKAECFIRPGELRFYSARLSRPATPVRLLVVPRPDTQEGFGLLVTPLNGLDGRPQLGPLSFSPALERHWLPANALLRASVKNVSPRPMYVQVAVICEAGEYRVPCLLDPEPLTQEAT